MVSNKNESVNSYGRKSFGIFWSFYFIIEHYFYLMFVNEQKNLENKTVLYVPFAGLS